MIYTKDNIKPFLMPLNSRFQDLCHNTYHRLTVKAYADKSRWWCECVCGNVVKVSGQDLKSGHTKSCGCWRKEQSRQMLTTHGQTGTPTHAIWKAMLQRCNNPKNADYPSYGGRGIKVCKRWQTFENFLTDMGERPKELTVERKDNDGDYCPENCQWDTRKAQTNNRQITIWITYQGERLTLRQWSDKLNIPYTTLWHRWKKKWSISLIFTPTKSRQSYCVTPTI